MWWIKLSILFAYSYGTRSLSWRPRLGEHWGSPARSWWAPLQMRGDFTKATESACGENAPAPLPTFQSPSQDGCQHRSSALMGGLVASERILLHGKHRSLPTTPESLGNERVGEHGCKEPSLDPSFIIFSCRGYRINCDLFVQLFCWHQLHLLSASLRLRYASPQRHASWVTAASGGNGFVRVQFYPR